MKTALFLLGLILTVLGGCSYPRASESPQWRRVMAWGALQDGQWTNGMSWPATSNAPEIVMDEGMEITAKTEHGDITIRAGDKYERFYTWDGATRSAKLSPRKYRWYGGFGLYNPGSGGHWRSNHGITRGVLEEGVLWFKTVKDALAWMQKTRGNGTACVYTDSGLLVTFLKVLPREQINVEVWQIMIDGRKPVSLPGSSDDSIKVSQMLLTQ